MAATRKRPAARAAGAIRITINGRRRSFAPEVAGRSWGLYAGTRPPDVDSQLADADPARSDGEGPQELRRAEAEFLGDDRRVGFHVER